jgi:hypothetical protein
MKRKKKKKTTKQNEPSRATLMQAGKCSITFDPHSLMSDQAQANDEEGANAARRGDKPRIPVWQSGPENPTIHEQLKALTCAAHKPPLRELIQSNHNRTGTRVPYQSTWLRFDTAHRQEGRKQERENNSQQLRAESESR